MYEKSHWSNNQWVINSRDIISKNKEKQINKKYEFSV